MTTSRSEVSDPVNHPAHYTFGNVEVIDVLEQWFLREPLLWQVGKYIARWDKKGDAIENLEKAQFYLLRKIEQLKAARRLSDQDAERAEQAMKDIREAALLSRITEGEEE